MLYITYGIFPELFQLTWKQPKLFPRFFHDCIWLCFKEWFPECVTQSISQINHSACQYQVYQGSTALLSSNLSSSHHPLGSPPSLNTSIFSAFLLLLVPYIKVFPIIFSVFTVFLNFNFLFFFLNLFIYLFIFGCVGSLFLCEGFL